LGSVTANRRSIVAMSNVVDFLQVASTRPAAANHVFLVSDGASLSTAELLRKLAEALGRTAVLLPVPTKLLRLCAGLLGRSSEADRLLGSLEVDASKAGEVLGWVPPFSLEESLRQAVSADRAH
jgi:nucleoside-diphosphate-sugar epimerase